MQQIVTRWFLPLAHSPTWMAQHYHRIMLLMAATVHPSLHGTCSHSHGGHNSSLCPYSHFSAHLQTYSHGRASSSLSWSSSPVSPMLPTRLPTTTSLTALMLCLPLVPLLLVCLAMCTHARWVEQHLHPWWLVFCSWCQYVLSFLPTACWFWSLWHSLVCPKLGASQHLEMALTLEVQWLQSQLVSQLDSSWVRPLFICLVQGRMLPCSHSRSAWMPHCLFSCMTLWWCCAHSAAIQGCEYNLCCAHSTHYIAIVDGLYATQ